MMGVFFLAAVENCIMGVAELQNRALKVVTTKKCSHLSAVNTSQSLGSPPGNCFMFLGV